MSYFEWFIRALGFWYCLTLVVGFSVFAWSCCELFRKAPIRFRGFHGVLLVLPMITALAGAIISRVETYLALRDLGGNIAAAQIAGDFVLSTASALVWGLFVSFPVFVVLLIGWLLRQPGPSTRSGPSP